MLKRLSEQFTWYRIVGLIVVSLIAAWLFWPISAFLFVVFELVTTSLFPKNERIVFLAAAAETFLAWAMIVIMFRYHCKKKGLV